MWDITENTVPGGCRYRILEEGTATSFRRFFDLLSSSGEFDDWYSRRLAASGADAFYWELPPLTTSTIENDLEFVLIDAPILARLPPDPGPFASVFANNPGESVAVFPNLGGDAILVAPMQLSSVDDYPHLAAFLRRGDPEQVRTLWKVTAATMLDRLSETPTWLSTSGLGVAWLHLRLDRRPKYYQHLPYKVIL